MIRRLITNRDNWDNTAVIEGERNISYNDIAKKALAIQKSLTLKRAKKAAILLPNGSDYIAAFYGTIMSGVTAFPLNASMTEYEIIPLLAQAGVDAVVTSIHFSKFFAGGGKAANLNIVFMEELRGDNRAGSHAEDSGSAVEPMVLLNTSGTMGKSKIVQLSEDNVAAAVLGYIDKMDYEGIDDIRYTFAMPFSNAYGLMVLSVCLMKSFPIVVLKNNFTLDAFYKAIEAHRITHYEGGSPVILMMESMAGRSIPYDISSLRYMAFGGSKVPGATVSRLRNAYPRVKFYQGYGMTEASPLIAKSPVNPDSVGSAIKDLKIAVEADGVISDAPYTKGEIIVKGPNVMLGYYENEAETNKVIKNGYLYTGDIGYLDEFGELYICGRKKNLIIVRGFNVHPEEVEECAQSSSLVKDCIAYGQKNDLGEEMVCMDAVASSPQIKAEDILAFLHDHLASYKLPRIINLRDEIRKNSSGKVQRPGGEGE